MTTFSGIHPSSLLYQATIAPRVREATSITKNMLKNGPTYNIINGPTYNPFSSNLHSMLEQDKQTDDNSVFFYEYRGLLNSRLSTLITKLTNALTSDLDNCLPDGTAGNPGGARATHTYFGLWGAASCANENLGLGVDAEVILNGATVSRGTTSLQTQQPFVMGATNNLVANLFVNLRTNLEPGIGGTEFVRDINTGVYDSVTASGGYTKFTPVAGVPSTILSTDALGVTTSNKTKWNVSSKFEAVLADAMSRPQYKDLIRMDLIKDIVVAATSTGPTGSQVFASLTLNGRRDINNGQGYGYIDVTHERWSAMYHS